MAIKTKVEPEVQVVYGPRFEEAKKNAAKFIAQQIKISVGKPG